MCNSTQIGVNPKFEESNQTYYKMTWMTPLFNYLILQYLIQKLRQYNVLIKPRTRFLQENTKKLMVE